MSYKSILAIALFFSSPLCVFPSAQAQTAKDILSNTEVDGRLSFKTQLQILSNAKEIEGSRIGVAAAPNPAYKPIAQAFKEIIDLGDAIEIGQLKALINRASPAGRLYLAAAIQRLNKTEGDRILTDLQSDQSLVTERSGCTGASYTVGNVAAELLKNGSISIYLP